MWEENFITKYNELIKRLRKADLYLSNPSVDDNIKMKWLSKYNEIIRDLSLMQKTYKKRFGKEIEEKEKFNGFGIDQCLL